MRIGDFWFKIALVLGVIIVGFQGFSQKLHPGFSKDEYLSLLCVTARQGDTPWTKVTVPFPKGHSIVYRSQTVGLDNRWDLWMRDDSVAIISIRGTTRKEISWMENFYSGMVAAKGTLTLADSVHFDYHLSAHPQATVHIGWLIGMASMAPDIILHINDLHKKGVKEFVIFGHSQGGAIAYLLTSHLLYLQRQLHSLPSSIVFKTYCSAAPKPGNLYYAYSFEHDTQGGWACNVVNTADWVPEGPFSIQKATDMNEVSPFQENMKLLGNQKFPVSWVLKYVYRRLKKTPLKAQKVHTYFLGKQAERIIQKKLPQYKAPSYAPTMNYVRTGNTIVLYADAEYFQRFPNDKNQLFIHHLAAPYYYLAQKLP